jgi:hypothetical protein
VDTKLTGWIDLIVKTVMGSISHFWANFGLYSSKYSKPILIIIALIVLRPFFKNSGVKIGSGGKR